MYEYIQNFLQTEQTHQKCMLNIKYAIHCIIKHRQGAG